MDTNKLSAQEKQVLHLFLDICPQWSDVILTQLEFLNVQRSNTSTNYTLLFQCGSFVPALHVATTMPIEVLLGNVTIIPEPQCKCVSNYSIIDINSNSVFKATDTTTVARLYIKSGILLELEIYSMSGTPLNFSNLDTKQRTYIIHDSELYTEIINQHFTADKKTRDGSVS